MYLVYDEQGRTRMRVAIASIIQESNTFSPVKTLFEHFSPVFGHDVLTRHEGRATEAGGFIHVLRRARCEVQPICAAWAITAGPMLRSHFRKLAMRFEEELSAAGRQEAFLFALHGAQVAQDCEDVSGYLLQRARRVLGPEVPIVTTLDLHANVTRLLVSQSTALVGYHTYPHVDMFECGVKAANLALKIVAEQIKPIMAFRKIPMIVPAENMQTTSGPFHDLIEQAEQWERAGEVESASVFGVQPWLDVDEMGCSVVVVTNGDAAAAGERASSLAKRFWDSRRAFSVELVPVEEAIREATAIAGGPIVFSESADSTGSGSPGDSTNVLRRLLAADLREPSVLFLVDPKTVKRAIEAGVGKNFSAKIGAAFDRKNSRPVLVTAHVRLLSDGRWTPWGSGYNPGIEVCMGRAAVLEIGSVTVLVAERPAMTVDPALYRSHGIEPTRMKIVVVKSPNGFRAEYEPIAKKIFMLDTPGVSSANLRSLPFQRIPRPMYPFDEARFAGWARP
jgi:microcystin degradation protein MlrC